MAAVFETGGLASELAVEASSIGFHCLFDVSDGVDCAGFRLCPFLHRVWLDVSTKLGQFHSFFTQVPLL